LWVPCYKAAALNSTEHSHFSDHKLVKKLSAFYGTQSKDKTLIQECLLEVDLQALMDKTASIIIMAQKKCHRCCSG
jgi:hypothetical protein